MAGQVHDPNYSNKKERVGQKSVIVRIPIVVPLRVGVGLQADEISAVRLTNHCVLLTPKTIEESGTKDLIFKNLNY